LKDDGVGLETVADEETKQTSAVVADSLRLLRTCSRCWDAGDGAGEFVKGVGGLQGDGREAESRDEDVAAMVGMTTHKSRSSKLHGGEK
jgi:hypothetical protein